MKLKQNQERKNIQIDKDDLSFFSVINYFKDFLHCLLLNCNYGDGLIRSNYHQYNEFFSSNHKTQP